MKKKVTKIFPASCTQQGVHICSTIQTAPGGINLLDFCCGMKLFCSILSAETKSVLNKWSERITKTHLSQNLLNIELSLFLVQSIFYIIILSKKQL